MSALFLKSRDRPAGARPSKTLIASAGIALLFLAAGNRLASTGETSLGITAAATGSQSAERAALAQPTAAQKQIISKWQRGASVYPESTTAYSGESAQATMRELRATGANSIALVIPLYQAGPRASSVSRGHNTPTDASLKSAIAYARSIGLSVVLKVHSDDSSKKPEWRGRFSPANHAQWFSSYQSWVVHFAKIGAAAKVSDVVVGTEFQILTRSKRDQQRWTTLIKAVREVFHGRVTYNANRGAELAHIKFWHQVDYIAVSGYYPMSSKTVAGLVKDWALADQRDLAPPARNYKKKIVFGEVGFRSMRGARLEPYHPGTRGPFSEKEQVDGYSALLQYWSKSSHFGGMLLWRFYTDLSRDWMEAAASYTPQTTATLDLLTRWFGGKAPTTTITPVSPSQGRPVQSQQPVSVKVATPHTDYTVRLAVDTGPTAAMTRRGNTNEWTATVASTTWEPSWRSGVHSLQFEVVSKSGNILARRFSLVYESVISSKTYPRSADQLRGVVTFKSALQHIPLRDYEMTWSVNDGRENKMSDRPGATLDDSDFKVAYVDVSDWHRWAPAGEVTLTFRARQLNGPVVATHSVVVGTPLAVQ